MTVDRFHFQRLCTAQTEGIVLNMGANEDPANLKQIDPDRVINCDIEAHDSYLDRPNQVDVVMDARNHWPFEDDYAELVVFGDILEHFYPEEAFDALNEAHRVAQKICITVPSDGRFEADGVQETASGYRSHCFKWTESNLTRLIENTGFEIVSWQTVDYTFVPEGYFVLAERKPEEYEIVNDSEEYFDIDKEITQEDIDRWNNNGGPVIDTSDGKLAEGGGIHGYRLLSAWKDS